MVFFNEKGAHKLLPTMEIGTHVFNA